MVNTELKESVLQLRWRLNDFEFPVSFQIDNYVCNQV